MPRPLPPDPAWRLRVGATVHDLAVRTLVVVTLDPVPAGGPDREWWARAGDAAALGADVLAVPLHPGPTVTDALHALRDRTGRPVAVGTADPAVVPAAIAAGAAVVVDPDGSGDPDLMAAVAAAGATLVVGPGGDPEAVVARAAAAGLPAERLAVDPGAVAMPAGAVRAGVVGSPSGADPRVAILTAVAVAVTAGARVVVGSEIVGTTKVVRMLEAIVARAAVPRPGAPVVARGTR